MNRFKLWLGSWICWWWKEHLMLTGPAEQRDDMLRWPILPCSRCGNDRLASGYTARISAPEKSK